MARGSGPRARRAVVTGSACAVVAGVLLAGAAPAAHAAGEPEVAPQVLRQSELAARLAPGPGATAVREVARGAQSSVNYWEMGSEMPAHLHRAHEEVIVVQSGTVEATVGSRRVVLEAGDVLLVPRDTVHSGRVAGSGPARGYSVFAPAFDGADRVPVAAPVPAP